MTGEEFLLQIFSAIHKKIFYIETEFVCFNNTTSFSLFEQDLKNKILWVNYPIVWKILQNKYSMNDVEIQSLIKDMAKKYLKINRFTSIQWFQYEVLR